MSARVSGHALIAEGAPHGTVSGIRIGYNGTSGEGCAKCSCGAMSESLWSAAERKRWHRRHKEEWRQQQQRIEEER